MIYLLLNLCDNSASLKILYLFSVLIRLICIIVPLILIITLMINLVKAIINSDDKTINSIKVSAINKIFSALIVFLIPSFINMFTSVIDFNGYNECIKGLSIDKINGLKKAEDKIKSEEYKKRESTYFMNSNKNNNDFKDNKVTTSNNSSSLGYSLASHTSSINGITYNIYNQSDQRWGSLSYGAGSMDASGCNCASVAVISSSYDSNITPINVINKRLGTAYSSSSIPQMTNNSFSCSHYSYAASASEEVKNDIINNLKKGNVVVVQSKSGGVYTCKNPGGCSHYMALIDISSDASMIFVGNEYSYNGVTSGSGWYKSITLLSDIHEVNICTPSNELINRFK